MKRRSTSTLSARHWWLLALVVAVTLSVTKCGPLATYRYKLTVNMETPEGPRSGSRVVEVRARKQMKFLPDVPPIRTEAEGQAIPLDLPNGKTIYVLLTGEGGYHPTFITPRTLVKPANFSPTTYESNVEKIRMSGGARLLPPSDYPALALVRRSPDFDKNNVEIVRPSELEAVLGAGYRLISMTLEYTEEPITTGINQRLPWARPNNPAHTYDVEGVMVGPSAFVR